MPEGTWLTCIQRARKSLRTSRWFVLAFLLFASGAAACTESLEGGGACPALCPNRANEFQDTILDVVVLDTSVGNFPVAGLNPFLLLANRGDTLQTSAVLRYDFMQTWYRRNGEGDTVTITDIDSVWIRLPLDSTGNRGTAPVLLEAFDVDTTQSDSVTAVVQSLFRADRLLGSVTFTPSSVGDSLRIPLNKDEVLDRLRTGARIRVGLRLTGHGEIRILAFAFGSATTLLSYDPQGDTTYTPIRVTPSTSLANTTNEHQLAYTVYPIVDAGTPPAPQGQLQIGGFPARRMYLRFEVPRRFLDSSTIVRAELLMTQVATPFARTTDSVIVESLVPTTTNVVTDLRRVLDLAAVGAFVGVDSTVLDPSESGTAAINVLGIVRSWRFLPPTMSQAIGLRSATEGSVAAEVRFLSSSAASAENRPRLRITYLPRAEFALP